MILDRKYFNLHNKCVIEKLVIKAPFRHGVVFENEACFLVVKDGQGALKSPTEVVPISVSEGVLLKCGNYFADLIPQTSPNQCELIAIHLPKELLRNLYKDEVPGFFKSSGSPTYAQKIPNGEIISHFIDSLDFYFHHPALVNEELLTLKLKELIALLIQTHHAKDIVGLFAHLFTPRQACLKEVIQTHLFSNLTVAELAKLAGRSVSSFKRDFENTFHDTPARYIREQRLLKAAEWLISTDLSVSEICFKTGFEDASHFTRLFKSKYQLGPSEYRKSKGKN